MVYGRKQASIHTHFHNAVTLVELAQAHPNYAPINFLRGKFSCKYLMNPLQYEFGFVAMTSDASQICKMKAICHHDN